MVVVIETETLLVNGGFGREIEREVGREGERKMHNS